MDAYDSMTNEEREEIHLDDEYRTVLTEGDVRRILDVPHEVNLSLPHLKSTVEVEAHRVLQLYSHELGDVHFAALDAKSQDGFVSSRSGMMRLGDHFDGRKKVRDGILLLIRVQSMGFTSALLMKIGEVLIRLYDIENILLQSI